MKKTRSGQRGIVVLASASSLSLVLGSVHAFSVFLEPLELRFGASRASVSLTYSLALVFLTLAVLTGHRIFSRWPAGHLVAVIGVIAAAGALIAAYAPSLAVLWLGYSVLFGGANGLGYAFGLQISAQSNPGREGVAMGIVTACYALGAAISPVLFSAAMSVGGFAAAMIGLCAALILVAPVCAGLMIRADAKFAGAASDGRSAADMSGDHSAVAVPARQIALLWLGYGAGVAAGLMAIGHAAGIARAAGLTTGLTGAPWLAPTLIAVCNMAGSFAGGWQVDHLPPVRLLASLPLISAAALIVLALDGGSELVLACLGLVGFTYGAIIAVYPATIAKMFGTVDGTRIYGRVFTAWGLAGLAAPWFAGYLFDRSGGYAFALTAAAFLGLVSAFAAFRLFRGDSRG